ncbi:hypothetical protein [Cupriavidus sp. TMH.W2]|uniref:hypothetical protein n=1 Tax=Cupriavidus sp. TMH.W2 TaxID=3434465 RepID=UPI003D76FEE4
MPLLAKAGERGKFLAVNCVIDDRKRALHELQHLPQALQWNDATAAPVSCAITMAAAPNR